jgi:hypothetical protein
VCTSLHRLSTGVFFVVVVVVVVEEENCCSNFWGCEVGQSVLAKSLKLHVGNGV